jgi:hypothetical protein
MKIFEDAVGTIAHDFDFELDDIRCDVEFAYATEDLDVPGRDVKKGTVAGLLLKWQGVSDGVVVIELISQWILAPEIDPPWEVAMAYLYEIEGTPNVRLRVDIVPDSDEASVEDLVTTGMIMTALPTINAIPGVVAARSGIITFKDLPPAASIIRPNAERVAAAQYSPMAPVDVADTAALANLNRSGGLPAATSVLEAGGIRGSAAAFLERVANWLRGSNGEAIPMGAPGSFEGTWNLVIKTPGKPVPSTLIVEKTEEGFAGTQSGEGSTEPIMNVAVEGGMVSWTSKITKPMRLKCDFKAVIDGDQLTGKVKAGIFGSFPFTGQKMS